MSIHHLDMCIPVGGGMPFFSRIVVVFDVYGEGFSIYLADILSCLRCSHEDFAGKDDRKCIVWCFEVQ
jgi:hypothetical protein